MMRRFLGRLAMAPVHVYRYAISPLLPPSCRFFPTCSEYALEAIGTHGPFAGSWLAARRLCRCHPLNRGGIDPVPPARPRLLRDGGTDGVRRWPLALRSPATPPAKME